MDRSGDPSVRPRHNGVASPLLLARMARPEVWMNPAMASTLHLANNDQVALSLENGPVTVQVKVDETLPEGVGLVPRSAGIPVSAPQAVKIQRLADAPVNSAAVATAS